MLKMAERIIVMSEANRRRGEKWSKALALAEFEEREENVKWIKSQASIVADMKAYSDSLPRKKLNLRERNNG